MKIISIQTQGSATQGGRLSIFHTSNSFETLMAEKETGLQLNLNAIAYDCF